MELVALPSIARVLGGKFWRYSFPACNFWFVNRWRSAHAHQFHFLGQNQSIVPQKTEKTGRVLPDELVACERFPITCLTKQVLRQSQPFKLPNCINSHFDVILVATHTHTKRKKFDIICLHSCTEWSFNSLVHWTDQLFLLWSNYINRHWRNCFKKSIKNTFPQWAISHDHEIRPTVHSRLSGSATQMSVAFLW